MPDIFVRPEKQKKEEPSFKNIPNLPKFRNRKSSMHFLTAFAFHPERLHYEAQEEDEKIILFLRRHFFTNISWIIVTFLLFILPFFAFHFFHFNFVPLSFRFIGVVGWYLLTFAFAFERFLAWFFNIDIITDQRVIDVDFPSILYKDISETKLEHIQDISSKTGGFIRSLLNFGNVLIQTAGSLPEFDFEDVPLPDQIVETINDLLSGKGDYQHDAF
jgi:uncharacterized membrane protein YdbT with pleckstrin-like domain